MSPIPSHSRLADVSNAALFRELTADNFAILAEEIGLRLASYQNGAPTTIIGPPTAGTFALAEFWCDALGGEFRCLAVGTPGTWIQTRPRAVTADPASGTIPTGYLVWNVTDGAVKRHAGSYSWEITVGAGTSAKVGFHGVAPTAPQVSGVDYALSRSAFAFSGVLGSAAVLVALSMKLGASSARFSAAGDFPPSSSIQRPLVPVSGCGLGGL